MQLQSLLSLSTASIALPIVKAAFVAPTHLVLNPKPTDLINASISTNSSNNHSLRRPSQDPFLWHLHGTSLALEFFEYGAEVVDVEALQFCYNSATDYIDDLLRVHGEVPVPTGARLRYSYKTSGFDIQQSPGMKYSTLEHVVSGLQRFHRTYGYFATRFKIHGHANREIGSGEVLVIRPPTSSNASVAVVQTPSAPFIFPIPYSFWSLSLNFTAFGKNIPNDDMTDVYVAAALYLSKALPKYGNIPIPGHISLHWSNGNASLTIEHEPNMTFGHLADVVRGLHAFQDKYDYTEASYQVVKQRKKKETIGSGAIVAVN